MRSFPVDLPRRRFIRAFELFVFCIVRQGRHVSLVRKNLDGSQTPLTMVNHLRIKEAT